MTTHSRGSVALREAQRLVQPVRKVALAARHALREQDILLAVGEAVLLERISLEQRRWRRQDLSLVIAVEVDLADLAVERIARRVGCMKIPLYVCGLKGRGTEALFRFGSR